MNFTVQPSSFSPALGAAFAAAIIVDRQGQPWRPSALPSFVISAYCPFSGPPNALLDQPSHRSLGRRLKRLGAAMEEVVGMAADGSWQELSWAVSGISEEQAIALGQRYKQWAIFRFDEQGRTVVDCWSII